MARAQQLTNATAKLIIYRGFIDDDLDGPKLLARRVAPIVLCGRSTKTESVECLYLSV